MKFIELQIEKDKAKWLYETLTKCKGFEKERQVAYKRWKRLEAILNNGVQMQFNFEEE